MNRAEHLAALRNVCKDWRALLHADPAHGRRVLRDLRLEKVVVRRDDQGRWCWKLVGTPDKLLGEKFFAMTDEALGAWIDEPDDVVEPIVQEAQDSCSPGKDRSLLQGAAAHSGSSWPGIGFEQPVRVCIVRLAPSPMRARAER